METNWTETRTVDGLRISLTVTDEGNNLWGYEAHVVGLRGKKKAEVWARGSAYTCVDDEGYLAPDVDHMFRDAARRLAEVLAQRAAAQQ